MHDGRYFGRLRLSREVQRRIELLLQSHSAERHGTVGKCQLAVGQREEAPLQLKAAVDYRCCRRPSYLEMAPHPRAETTPADQDAIGRVDIQVEIDNERLLG